TWRAENGQIVASPQNPDGGWLILDKGYQDVEMYTEFTCGDKCEGGILLRAEKTPNGGLKGVYVSFSNADAYDVTLNSDGKELCGTRLPRSSAQFARIAAGPWTNGQAHVPGFAQPAVTLAEQEEDAGKPPAPPTGRAAAAAQAPGGPPRPTIRAGEWNTI